MKVRREDIPGIEGNLFKGREWNVLYGERECIIRIGQLPQNTGYWKGENVEREAGVRL